jgi:hypothetical protein
VAIGEWFGFVRCDPALWPILPRPIAEAHINEIPHHPFVNSDTLTGAVTHSLLRRHTIDEPTRRRAVAIAAAWRLSASAIRCSPVDWCPAQQPPCIGWSRVLANLIATTGQRCLQSSTPNS